MFVLLLMKFKYTDARFEGSDYMIRRVKIALFNVAFELSFNVYTPPTLLKITVKLMYF